MEVVLGGAEGVSKKSRCRHPKAEGRDMEHVISEPPPAHSASLNSIKIFNARWGATRTGLVLVYDAVVHLRVVEW